MRISKLCTVFAAVMACLMLLSGCMSAAPTAAPTTAPAATPEPTQAPTATPEPTPEPDPWGKYPEPIELTHNTVFAGWMTLEDGEDQDNNWWTKIYEEKLNIKLTCKWAASEWGGDFDQKFNQSLASDDLPDLIYAYTSLGVKCMKNNKVVDLAPLYEQYASQQLRDLYAADDNALKSWVMDGKTLGLPTNVRRPGDIQGFWLRKDWLTKLNLPVPKTIAEVENIAREFIKQKPGGVEGTYGIALAWDSPFFNSARAYFNVRGGKWVDIDGKLAKDDIQPENKVFWQKAADWYKEGILPKDFAVKKDDPDIRQDIVNEKAGIWWGYASDSDATTMKDLVTKNGEADFVWVRPPAIDGNPVKYIFDAGYGNCVMASAKTKYPEALIKMLNLGTAIYNEPKPDFITDLAYRQGATGKGWAEFWRCVGMDCPQDPFMEMGYLNAAVEAFKTKDLSKLGITAKQKYYDAFVAWAEKGKDDPNWLINWGTNFYGGPEGTLHEVNKLLQEKQDYSYSPWWGLDTDAMAKNGENWFQKFRELRTLAIINNDVGAQFDAWVAFFNANGGEQATAEANEWYATHK